MKVPTWNLSSTPTTNALVTRVRLDKRTSLPRSPSLSLSITSHVAYHLDSRSWFVRVHSLDLHRTTQTKRARFLAQCWSFRERERERERERLNFSFGTQHTAESINYPLNDEIRQPGSLVFNCGSTYFFPALRSFFWTLVPCNIRWVQLQPAAATAAAAMVWSTRSATVRPTRSAKVRSTRSATTTSRTAVYACCRCR